MPVGETRDAWRLAATHTHLYPGARVIPRDGLDPPRRGDVVAVEFADQVVARGKVLTATPTATIVEVAAYRTARGTAIARKRWTFGRESAAATEWKVTAKGTTGADNVRAPQQVAPVPRGASPRTPVRNAKAAGTKTVRDAPRASEASRKR